MKCKILTWRSVLSSPCPSPPVSNNLTANLSAKNLLLLSVVDDETWSCLEHISWVSSWCDPILGKAAWVKSWAGSGLDWLGLLVAGPERWSSWLERLFLRRAAPRVQMVKNPPARHETQVRSLVQEDLLEEEMATHSSLLAWETPWTEEPGGLHSMGSQGVRNNLAMEPAHIPPIQPSSRIPVFTPSHLDVLSPQ